MLALCESALRAALAGPGLTPTPEAAREAARRAADVASALDRTFGDDDRGASDAVAWLLDGGSPALGGRSPLGALRAGEDVLVRQALAAGRGETML